MGATRSPVAPPVSGGRSRPRSGAPRRARRGPPPGPPFLREERSPARATLLIVGGVLAVVVVLVLALTVLGGGGSSGGKGSTATLSSAPREASETRTSASAGGEGSALATDPAETPVVVLNATGTTGLAHRLSSNLQQSGYSLAEASNARPAEARSTSVVEYASGHRLDAEHVAQTLGVSTVQPLDASTAALAGSATVVVIAGADQSAVP